MAGQGKYQTNFSDKSQVIDNLNFKRVSKEETIPLFFKISKMKINSKLKFALVKINLRKLRHNRAQILKIRQEKLQKFRIDYLPLCADEDWEAMAEFYAKSNRK